MENWQRAGFGIYVHWPFCQAKCPYCDFNSHVAAHIDQDRWLAAYRAEIARWARRCPDRTVSSVFFGGGTPSMMEPRVTAGILDAIAAAWPMSNAPEITLEANPTSVEAERFRGYRNAGVNRVSMGIQALDDGDLKRLGRLHDADEARRAFDTARATFDRCSFDLIYARQDQTLEGWRLELTEALGMAADHLSLYQLTIEPGTAFHARFSQGGLKGLPDEDLSADLYELTQALCEDAGLPAYEVSNHAATEDRSRHNLIYWSGGDYVGIGPGAHGRIGAGSARHATVAPSAPGRWLADVEAGQTIWDDAPLPVHDQYAEYLMMALRITEGAERQRLDELNTNWISSFQDMVENDFIELTEDRVRVTRAGRPVLNGVLRNLLA
ncbi:radical SAM family heme chaperone HemW [Profundibacterium mesophilum]|uniref:radical SAM family heme chaperone HemW n=1 Tax=Profundibacterium mesophilum TaxID=1258573 RepID=UPI00135C9F73|nr:radical SAM family heme chaperone HemW [Profundibacterium mesophilum]